MAYTEDGIVDMHQIRTGFLWNLPRVNEQKRYKDWYEGKFDSLFGAPNLTNGRSLYNHQDIVRIQLFRDCSNFYRDVMRSSRPMVTADNTALQAWLDENRPTIQKALDRAVEHYTVMGRLIIMTTADGRIRPVRPYEHVSVKAPHDEEIVIGHNLVYTWRAFDPANVNQHQLKLHNRCMVTRWSEEEGIDESTTYAFNGVSIGAQLGPTKKGGVTGIYASTESEGFYDSIKDAAGMMMTRLTLANKGMNLTQAPKFFAPASSQPAVQEKISQNDATGQTFAEQVLDGRGMVILIDPQQGAGARGLFGWNVFQFDNDASQSMVEYLANSIYVGSGVPPSAFGVHLGKGESGEARRAAMMRSAQQVKELRNEIEGIYPMMAKGLGAPEGDIKFQWDADPFQSEEDFVNYNLRLLQAKVMTPDEVREALGFGKLPQSTNEEVTDSAGNDPQTEE